MSDNPVTDLAKERQGEQQPLDTFEVDGVTCRLCGVPSGLIQDAMSRVQEPEVPMWHNPDKDREEPNPNDPRYLKQMSAHRQNQNRVANDTMAMFGVEIVSDFPPQDDKWARELQFASRQGLLDLEGVDWDDPIELEFVFKKNRVVTSARLIQISGLSGLEGAIAQAKASFRGN